MRTFYNPFGSTQLPMSLAIIQARDGPGWEVGFMPATETIGLPKCQQAESQTNLPALPGCVDRGASDER